MSPTGRRSSPSGCKSYSAGPRLPAWPGGACRSCSICLARTTARCRSPSDLKSFWTTTYHQVRKDLRGAIPSTRGRKTRSRPSASAGVLGEAARLNQREFSNQNETCGTCRSFSTSSSKSWAGAKPNALATRFVGNSRGWCCSCIDGVIEDLTGRGDLVLGGGEFLLQDESCSGWP